NFLLFLRKMAQNDIDNVLDHLRRIKSGGDLSRVKILQIETLEMQIRFFRTFIKYHRVLLLDFLVKITEKAELIVEMLHSVFPVECETNLNVERLVSQLLEFSEGNTNLMYNYELNDSDMLDYMDCLDKNLNDVQMCMERFIQYNRFLKQMKIIQKKMRFLRYLYATEINGYVDNEKLNGLETRVQFMADNVGQFCFDLYVNLNNTCIGEDEYERDSDEDEDKWDSDETDTDEDEYEIFDILSKPPYLLCLIVLVELEMKKIFLGELKASKFTQSKTFKNKKLPKGYSHHLQSLLMYLRNKKLENFPNNNSAQNIDVAIEFLLVLLDADVSNHVINGNWLNEIMEKVGAIAGDILYVIQKLLPNSINKDDTSKISLCSIRLLEKTEDLKAQVETYYKSLKFTLSKFPTFGGLSFLDSLLSKLNEMSKSKSALEKEFSSLTTILEIELSSLTLVFRDVVKVQHKHEEVFKDLLRHTVNLAYEAEVSVDSILVQYNALSHTFCSLPAIIKEIKHIRARVTEMRFQNFPLKPFSVVEPSKHLPTQHRNPVNDEVIVGFKNEAEKIIQYLIKGPNEINVISIVGAWEGKGKRLLLESQVTGSKDKGDKDDVLADMLRRNLIGKRYLIVLDDMWDGMAWDDIRHCFPDVGNRSRIMVTTRLEKVGEQIKYHTDPYSLPFLPVDESCKLLQKKVFQEEGCPPELQDVSRKIAEKCKGLPLVIILAAGIIKRNKMEASWWDEVKDSLFSYLGDSEGYSLSIMQLSYNNLPDYLKPCLLYMGMFREDAIIPVSKLISLWIAEGFMQNIESGRIIEEAAEDYLMDLISSNVVMVSKREYNGKVKYCHVHDVVLHFCLEKGRQEKFMLSLKGDFQQLDRKESRVSFNHSNKISKFAALGSETLKPFHQHLRSLIMTNKGKCYYWIRQVRLLKVLDLSSHRVHHVSSATMKPLIHLKYLAVSAEELDFHPEPHLLHLETLIVEGLFEFVVLPETFWKMEKLRHVEINHVEFDLNNNKQGMFEESSKLENLRILKEVEIMEDIVDVLLQRCPNLRELDIFIQSDRNSPEICLKMESLQILTLSFERSLFLSGLQLPSSLKKLKLSGPRIESVIPFIAGLPSLEYFEIREWTGIVCNREWCLGDITFHKLKFLKLVMLGISTWDASEESFPMLETLVIQYCDKLKEIPLSFADIPTLKQIKLIGHRKESLEASALQIEEDVEYIEGCNRLNVIIRSSDEGSGSEVLHVCL
ncbi:hypothetical protein MTR67_040548, partial [Solanum verrucosum]